MVGAEIRRAREAAGLTQEKLAELARIHRTYVSLLEREKKSPTVAMLFRLCSVLGVRPSVVIARVEASVGRQPERQARRGKQ
jgi:transcriptional regulator with XRE-family HTH domain